MAQLDEDRDLRPAPEMTVRIPKCASCGQEHEAVAVKALTTPQKPFTHWFSCPTNGDPVPMSLMLVDDQTAMPIHSQVGQSIVRCLLSRRYMMAFWRVENGMIHIETPVRYEQFPNADFGRAVGLLVKVLREQLGKQTLGIPSEFGLLEEEEKMPEAPKIIKPTIKLFGEEPEAPPTIPIVNLLKDRKDDSA